MTEKLTDWRKANMTMKEFVHQIGVTRDTTVYNWLAGKSKPSAVNMRAIYRLTKGQVDANDWFEGMTDDDVVCEWRQGHDNLHFWLDSTTISDDTLSRALNIPAKNVDLLRAGLYVLRGHQILPLYDLSHGKVTANSYYLRGIRGYGEYSAGDIDDE